MTLRTKLLAAAFMLAMATPASALTVSLVGGIFGPPAVGQPANELPANFGLLRDFNGDLATQRDAVGDPLTTLQKNLFAGVSIGDPITRFTSLTDTGSDGLTISGLGIGEIARVTFTYIGTEAANTNTTESSILTGGVAFFNNKTAIIGDTRVANFGAGLLDFSFTTTPSGGSSLIASNSGSIATDLTLAFGNFLPAGAGVSSLYAFLGDGAGDNDLDDIVIKIDIEARLGTIGEVPLPAALPLYGTGLAIMGFIGWRRKRKSAA